MSGEGATGLQIDRFLACRELDDLAALAVPYGQQSADERAAVAAALAGGDRQAVANVLMHPAVIAPGEHFGALERALGEESSYLTLAAVVGLQDVDPSTLIEHQAAWVAQRLLDLSAGPDRLIAERASVTLWTFASVTHVEALLTLVDSGHDVVRHNAVVALFSVVDPVRAIDVLRHHVHSQPVSDATAELVRTALVAFDGREENGGVSEFDVPLLSYVPNLDDW